MGIVSRVMAGCVSMAAFAVAIIAGMAGGNPAVLVLGRALIAMVVCYPVGLIVGFVCERVIAMHGKDVEQQNPLPTDDGTPAGDGVPTDEQERADGEEVLVV